MDAPQLPDAESSAQPVGGQPSGQASTFRRTLDAQVEVPEPSKALVPTDPHDHTTPINVAILRTLLASGKSSDAAPAMEAAPEPMAGMPPFFPEPATLPAQPAAVPAVPPSASGPTVVMPAVSAPELRAPTTIASVPDTMPANAVANNVPANAAPAFAGIPMMTSPAAVAVPDAARGGVGGHGGDGDGPREREPSPRHNAKPSRLPTAVWISALLGACAAAALVLFNAGHSPDPLAPTALPTKAATHSPSPKPSPTPSPSHKPSPSPSPSPSHASPSPSHKPSPSPSPSRPSASASPSPTGVASFATIYWTSSSDPRVEDIQRRLAQLNYMYLIDNAVYVDSNRGAYQSGRRQYADPVGMYQYATDSAIRAFKFDYLQHDQGSPPASGCDWQTYQALVNATS